MAYFNLLSHNFHKESKENEGLNQGIDLWNEPWTQELQKTKQECYPHNARWCVHNNALQNFHIPSYFSHQTQNIL